LNVSDACLTTGGDDKQPDVRCRVGKDREKALVSGIDLHVIGFGLYILGASCLEYYVYMDY
jgi:hypothetical protein